MMKHIHTIVLLIMLLPLSSMAQSLEIVEDFKENKMSTVLTTYKNEFGHREKQHVMDNKFPFAVLEVYLDGDEQAVKAAKSKISLDLGSHFTVEGVCKTYTNRIVFLISSSVRNVYMTCGDGCKEQVIFSGQTLEQNKIYSGRVKYTPAKVTPTPTPNPKKQIFSFEVNPKKASVEVLVGEKSEYCRIEDDIQSITLNHGTYKYIVSAPRYQTETGIIHVSDSTRTKSVQLLPDFGWLTLSATESNRGASAYVINTTTKERIALGNIPLASYELDRGEYLLQIFQNKYKDFTKKITILPNQTIKESPVLEPNFISLTLSTDADSEILVNGESFGKGQWSGTLELGEYAVETRKAHHRSSYIPLTLTHAEATQTITLASPTPIYGSLMVSGSPAKASIYIDDKYVGESPMIVNDLLIGEHQIKVDKDGYAVWKKMVTVAENEEGVVTYELEKGISLDRVALKGLNATNLSVKREGGETFVFTYDLPKKGPVRLRMSTDGYTYTTQKNVQGDVGKEMDKGEQYQIAWTIPEDLGQVMQDSLYFQIVALPELPKEKIKIDSLYYQAVDDGTSVGVAQNNYEFIKINIPLKVKTDGHEYSVTSIGELAFFRCSNLTSVTIPNSVTSIGFWAFSGCDNLTSIIVDKNNPIYDSRNDCNAIIETATNTLIAGCKNTVIPNSVTRIGNDAFFDCSNLTSITIPNSVTSIGKSVFESCDDLTSIIVDKNNPIYDSRNNCNAIIETATNTLIAGCKNTVIPNSVTSIGEDAFSECENLTSISIPNSVTSIGYGAFSECPNLTSITIPNSVTSIGNFAFFFCDNLASITIPNSVTSIGYGAFACSYNLKTIYIPRGTKAKFAAMEGLKDHGGKLVEQ